MPRFLAIRVALGCRHPEVNNISKITKMKPSIEIEVQDIDHLGLIAGIIDDIGIVDLVDQELGTHTRLVSKCRTINFRFWIRQEKREGIKGEGRREIDKEGVFLNLKSKIGRLNNLQNVGLALSNTPCFLPQEFFLKVLSGSWHWQ